MRGRGTRPNMLDLFSRPSARESESVSPAPPTRHVLPKDLPNAIKQLRDDELERLLDAVAAEQKVRGKKPEKTFSDKRQVELAGVTLTPSKMNAVRAAFKAGFRPSQIARQFGLSQTDVRKVLTSGRE
jgi:predicted DNA-binding protein (UPF0251 family)